MATHFEVAACHSNHAGRAYLTLNHLGSGAQLILQHLPFEHDHAETIEAQQHRIASEALAIVRAALDYLETQVSESCRWPDAEWRVGAGPHENEPPNAFGYPMERY